MEKNDIIQAIKDDLRWATEDGFNTNVGYKLLDDGNLVVQTYTEQGRIDKTYIVSISLGRELAKEEWQEP